MENVEDVVGDVSEVRRGGDGVPGDAVASDGGGGDDAEVRGADEGGVARYLHQPPRA